MRAQFVNDIVLSDGYQIDVRAYGTTFDDVTIQACIDAIGALERTMVIAPETWSITDNVTVPDNISLKILSGGVLAVDTGKKFTIDGSLEAGLYQICSGDGRIVYGRRVIELYPEWQGAVGDASLTATATDDGPAFIATIADAAGSTCKTIRVTGLYYIHTGIALDDDNEGLKFVGNNTSRGEGTPITGSALITDIDMITIGNATTASTYADFVFDGVAFYEISSGQAHNAITVYTMPWGLEIKNCRGVGFKSFLYAGECADVVDLGYAAYATSITWSTFYNNINVISSHANSYFLAFIFDYNLAHQNTHIISATFRGNCSISYNNLEGTHQEPITLSATPDAGTLYLTFRGNYFEHCTADGGREYLAYLQGSSNGLRAVIEHNNTSRAVAYMDYSTQLIVLGVTSQLTLNDSTPVVIAGPLQYTSKGFFENPGNYPIGVRMDQAVAHRAMVSNRAYTKAAFSPTYEKNVIISSGFLTSTPYGDKGYLNITAVGSNTSFLLSKTLPINTLGVATVLMRYNSSTGGSGNIGFYDNGASAFVAPIAGYGIRVGEFQFVTVAIQSAAATLALDRLYIYPFRLATYSGDCDIYDVTYYEVPAATNQMFPYITQSKETFETMTATAATAIGTRGVTAIDTTLGAMAGLTLADGVSRGQTKMVIMTVDNGDATLTIAHHETADGETALFDDVDEYLSLLWTGTEWATVSSSCSFP